LIGFIIILVSIDVIKKKKKKKHEQPRTALHRGKEADVPLPRVIAPSFVLPTAKKLCPLWPAVATLSTPLQL
jgi:hypothetical protein